MDGGARARMFFERTVRHNGVVAAWCSAAKEGLAAPVTQCLKGYRHDVAARNAAAAAAADLNVGHVPDFAAPRGGAARSGRHLVGEVKSASRRSWSTRGGSSRTRS